MGHELVGSVPRSQQWVSILSDLEAPGLTEEKVKGAAEKTLANVSSRYSRLRNDRSVQAAFRYLLALPHSAKHPEPDQFDLYPALDLREDPSPLRLVASLQDWVRKSPGSSEYQDIAGKAAADAIIRWTRRQRRQGDLFHERLDARAIWKEAGTGAGFCEVARGFFSGLTERYLKYFLDRELSASLDDVESREAFEEDFEEYVEDISQFAFETSKIAQSFSAGWYNRHAATELPNVEEVNGFLAHALGKMRDELMREQED